jgi:hypothetical protein
VIHFDLDDRYLDENVVGSAISRREAVMLAIAGHVVIGLLLVYAPPLSWFRPSEEELARLERELEREDQQMVFVQPLADIPALRAPELAPPSDADRRAQSPEPRDSDNPLPRLDGNSDERNEPTPPEEVARGAEELTPPAPQPPAP